MTLSDLDHFSAPCHQIWGPWGQGGRKISFRNPPKTVYHVDMTKIVLILFALLWAPSCMQTYNSNTGDEGLTGNCATGSNPKFKPAVTIIKKHCISCHSGYHNGYSSYCTEDAWINAGLVTKGDHMNSTLITIMKNYSGAGTMPKDSPAIPSDEYDDLKDWIDTMP